MSNARVAAAAETFVRRKIDDLVAMLPHPSDHTPPRTPHHPTTKRRGRPRRRSVDVKAGKDRKSVDDKKQDRTGKESEEDETDEIHAQSSFTLRPRDSLILSQNRLSRERVSTD